MADLRLGWVTIADALRQVVMAAGIVALALAGAALLPFFAVAVVAGLAALALTLRLAHGIPLRPALRAARCAVGCCATRCRSRSPSPSAAVYFRLGHRLRRRVRGRHRRPATSGHRSASSRCSSIVPQLAIGAAFPIFARAAADDRERLRYALQQDARRRRCSSACSPRVGLGVGAPFVIEVVAGPGFAPAADVLRLHALAFVGAFTAAVFGYALLSLRRHRAVLAVSAAALLVAMLIAGPDPVRALRRTRRGGGDGALRGGAGHRRARSRSRARARSERIRFATAPAAAAVRRRRGRRADADRAARAAGGDRRRGAVRRAARW